MLYWSVTPLLYHLYHVWPTFSYLRSVQCLNINDIEDLKPALEDKSRKSFSVPRIGCGPEEKKPAGTKQGKASPPTFNTIAPTSPWAPASHHPMVSFRLAVVTSSSEKMTGGTPEVRSDKSLTLLTFDI